MKEIGEVHGGMEVSAVSQAIRRLYQRIAADRKLERNILKIEREVKKLSTV